MEYNNLILNQHDKEINRDFFILKNNLNHKNLNKLEQKIIELQNKILFLKKYDNKIIINSNEIIDNTINTIEFLLSEINSKIIMHGKINRKKEKNIELEF